MHAPAHDDVNVYRKLNRILWNIGILYYFFISLLVSDWFGHTRFTYFSVSTHEKGDELNQNKRYYKNNGSRSMNSGSGSSSNIILCHQQQMTTVNKRLPIKFATYILCVCVRKERKKAAEQNSATRWCLLMFSVKFDNFIHISMRVILYLGYLLPFDLTIVSFNFVIVNESC